MSWTNLAKDKFFLSLVQDGIWKVNTKTGVVTNAAGRVLGCRNSVGYMVLGMRIRGTGENLQMKAHRLVWAVAHGLTDDPCLTINHLNGVKHDNRLANLELVTMKVNNDHSYAIGLKVAARGEEHFNAMVTNKMVPKLRRQFLAGKITIDEIAERYSFTVGSARNLLIGKTYSCMNDGTEKLCAEKIHEVYFDFTDKEVLAIRHQYRDCPNLTLTALARHFGCNIRTIKRLITGQTFGHLPDAMPVREYQTPAQRLLHRNQAKVVRMNHQQGYSYARIARMFQERGHPEITRHVVEKFVAKFPKPHAVTTRELANQHAGYILRLRAEGFFEREIVAMLQKRGVFIPKSTLHRFLIAKKNGARLP